MTKIVNFCRVNDHNTTFQGFFMMIYINSCILLVYQMNIYRSSTHIDVNWRQFNVKMIKKIRKLVNFCCVNGHNTTFQWSLWWLISSFAQKLKHTKKWRPFSMHMPTNFCLYLWACNPIIANLFVRITNVFV